MSLTPRTSTHDSGDTAFKEMTRSCEALEQACFQQAWWPHRKRKSGRAEDMERSGRLLPGERPQEASPANTWILGFQPPECKTVNAWLKLPQREICQVALAD